MSEASYPDGLYYNEEHDWARVDGEVATFGITWYAQDSLGEVVYFAPSAVGTTIERGGEYGDGRDRSARVHGPPWDVLVKLHHP